ELTRPITLRKGPDPALFYLGLSCMRWGENQNCVSRHTSDSCLFPIAGNGIHTQQEGSWSAIKWLTECLESSPDLSAAWLLNIAYVTVGEYADKVPQRYLIHPATFASDEEFPRFYDAAPRLGLNTVDLAGGAIVDDFDGDGALDIV